MTAGTNLMKLKRNAEEARSHVSAHEKRKASWYEIVLLFAVLFAALGLGALIVGIAMTQAYAQLGKGLTFGPFIIAGAVALGLIGFFVSRIPSILESRDKELARLKAEETDAREGYNSNLLSEAQTYGIDTSTMRNRSELLNSDYEFTAQRNGEPIDITVREFNNEIVFMLNGERMQKPVTV